MGSDIHECHCKGADNCCGRCGGTGNDISAVQAEREIIDEMSLAPDVWGEDEVPEMVWPCCGKTGMQHLGIEGTCRKLREATAALVTIAMSQDMDADYLRSVAAECWGKLEARG